MRRAWLMWAARQVAGLVVLGALSGAVAAAGWIAAEVHRG